MDGPSRLIALRRADTCISCGRALPAATNAYWHAGRREVRCVSCSATAEAGMQAAGASAQREHERRKRGREGRLRERYGRMGAVAAWWSDSPQHEQAWALGARGEAANAARFAQQLADTPVRMLHDRRIAGRRSNIDHIAIGPGGVTVIDSKNLFGSVRVDWSGGLFSPRRYDLRVNGRRRTSLVESVEAQIELVRSVLDQARFADVPVIGALCFANVDGPPLLRRLRIGEVAIDGPRRVSKLAARPGTLTPQAIDEITVALASRLPPA